MAEAGPRIAEFREGQTVEGFYAVADANMLTSSRGSQYIRLTLADATGQIQGNLWDATQEIFLGIPRGGVVKVRAAVERFRGSLQIKVTAIRPAADGEADPSLFIATTDADVGALEEALDGFVASVEDVHYRALLEAIFGDAGFREGFRNAPAAKQNHHAYQGGLLEHTVSVTRLAENFCTAGSTPVHRDLLITGALLHDMGKVEELSAGAAIDYTDPGKLVGHLVLGALRIAATAAALPDFPPQKRDLLLHLVLSHHGKREYGSPILPATPEALALHHLDNLDAKTVAARRLIDEHPDPESRWTERSYMLETALYREPSAPAEEEGS